MARQTTITDDMDGSPNPETISYSFDGQDYEIDLSPENREKFRRKHSVIPSAELSRRDPRVRARAAR